MLLDTASLKTTSPAAVSLRPLAFGLDPPGHSRPSRGNRDPILAAPTKIVGEFATDYRKYHLVDDKAKKEHQSWEQAYRVNQPQTRLSGVAVPSETASRLIAVVRLDNDFPLMPGVVATDRVMIVHTPVFLLYSNQPPI